MMRLLIVGVLLMVNSSSGCFTLSGTPTAQTATSCPMESIANGGVSYVVTPVVTCNSGYVEQQGQNRQCDGTSWSGTPSTCVRICSAVTVANADTPVYSSSDKEEGSTVTVTCSTNYVKTSGDAERTCQADGTWSGTEPVCTRTCPEDSVANADTPTYSSSDKIVGSTITIACSTGYAMTAGDPERTCEASGSWGGTKPTCTKTCPEDPVANAAVSYSTTFKEVGSTITATCNSGYVYTAGDLTRTCQADGTWDGTQPVCTITCPEESITNADPPTYSPQDRRQGGTITVTCSTGSIHSSGDAERTCGSDGQWGGTEPVCDAPIG